MRVLIALDLNDEDLTEAFGLSPAEGLGMGSEWEDINAALSARLGYGGSGEAIYCGKGDMPIRGSLVAVGDVTDVLPEFLSAAEVGGEGHPDDAVGGHIVGTVQTMRQCLNA